MTLYGGALLNDIVDDAPAARRQNRSLAISPTAMPAANGPAAGLTLGGTF